MHCGRFRANDGTVFEPPQHDRLNGESCHEFSKRYGEWLHSLTPLVVSSRCACDPDHPANRGC